MKSASGKRPPDEAHGPGKEAITPQQRELLRILLLNPVRDLKTSKKYDNIFIK
jgi:hypothetical protein